MSLTTIWFEWDKGHYKMTCFGSWVQIHNLLKTFQWAITISDRKTFQKARHTQRGCGWKCFRLWSCLLSHHPPPPPQHSSLHPLAVGLDVCLAGSPWLHLNALCWVLIRTNAELSPPAQTRVRECVAVWCHLCFSLFLSLLFCCLPSRLRFFKC